MVSLTLCELLESSKIRPIVPATSERAYILPHPALRDIVSHYTLFMPRNEEQSAEVAGTINIVPDASGCIVCRIGERRFETLFWGPSSNAVRVRKISQVIPLYVMTEFLPCGASDLLGVPMPLFHNAVAPLEAVSPRLARQIDECLDALYCRGLPFRADLFLARLELLLLQCLDMQRDTRLSRFVVDAVTRVDGATRVSELSARTDYSQRHLSRKMAEELGIGLKLFTRIIRVNAACRRMASPTGTMTELAYSLGYHDQAHFIHDFTGICGMSPRRYLSRMSEFYNEGLKLGGTLLRRSMME